MFFLDWSKVNCGPIWNISAILINIAPFPTQILITLLGSLNPLSTVRKNVSCDIGLNVNDDNFMDESWAGYVQVHSEIIFYDNFLWDKK